MACELESMLSKLSPEEQECIRAKADNLEVLFKGDTIYMKDKDEDWCDGMFDDEQLINETIEEMNNEKY